MNKKDSKWAILERIIIILLSALIQVSVFIFFGAFFIALTNWMIYWFPNRPIIFNIGWIIGVVALWLKILGINWFFIKLNKKELKK